MQLAPTDVDTTLAVGALNNIIANNNLTAQFGTINTKALLANGTQAALNATLGPIQLYPLRIGAGVFAECTEPFLVPSTYYALETAYTGTSAALSTLNHFPHLQPWDTCKWQLATSANSLQLDLPMRTMHQELSLISAAAASWLSYRCATIKIHVCIE